MKRDPYAAMAAWLERGTGQIGEVLVRKLVSGYELRHVADADREGLSLESARKVALHNDRGEYRPLKTAPDLRRGWRIEVADLPELRAALDLLYPAMIGVKVDFAAGHLRPVALRETLGRQTGMYAVTKKLTDDQAQALIGNVCRSDGGCLKTILWRIADDVPVGSLPAEKFDSEANQAAIALGQLWPLLCQEGCNILVAKARELIKGT